MRNKPPRCDACNKRIPNSEPDIVLKRDGSEQRRFYHVRCVSAAQRLIRSTPDLWFMTHRHVDEAAN